MTKAAAKKTTYKQEAKPQGGWNTDALVDPRHVFILSGGIAAGKTTIVRRLVTDFRFVTGSPADILKERAAQILAEELGEADAAEAMFYEMLEQSTKAEYRDFLVAFGEFVSNRDQYHWGTQAADAAAHRYEVQARAGITGGIVFDSMRRPAEIIAVKQQWPNAVHIHLVVSRERQIDYLVNVLDYSEEKAQATLDNASEHWLDDMDGTEYDAQYVIDANADDETTWLQMMGIVVLGMTPGEAEVVKAVLDS